MVPLVYLLSQDTCIPKISPTEGHVTDVALNKTSVLLPYNSDKTKKLRKRYKNYKKTHLYDYMNIYIYIYIYIYIHTYKYTKTILNSYKVAV